MPESAGEPLAAATSHGPQPMSPIAPAITPMTNRRSSGAQLLRVAATSSAINAIVKPAYPNRSV